MQQWERWCSQAPVRGRYTRNKKKGSSPIGRKKTVTYGTAHPPTTDDAVHPPPTHRPNLYYIPVQQYSSTYSSTPGTRGAVSWLVLEDLVRKRKQAGGVSFFDDTPHLGERASRHPPPTHHPSSTHGPTQYSSTAVQQYSNAAVRRAIHLTGEQQPIRQLQCSRVGRIFNCLLFLATPGSKRKALALPILRTASGDGCTLL